MGRRVTSFAIAALVATTLSAALAWQAATARSKTAAFTADSLRARCAVLAASYDSLKKNCAPSPEEEHDGHFWMRQSVKARDNQWMLLHEHEIGELRRRGLADPVNDLRNDLKAHAELIPVEPSPTLRWGIGPIALLSTRWAYAQYEDGHYMGNILLEYEVLPGGKIRWKVLGAGLM